MAKANSKPFTFRLGEVAQTALRGLMVVWGIKNQTAVVERALGEMYGLVTTGEEVEGGEAIQPPMVSTPAERAAAMVGQLEGAVASAPAAAPFNPKCFHCGQNFGAWNRNASLCPGCKERNHYGDPRECRACGDLQGAL